jgi:hypothetical protein
MARAAPTLITSESIPRAAVELVQNLQCAENRLTHLAFVGVMRDLRDLGGLPTALGNRQRPRELDDGIHLSLLPLLEPIDGTYMYTNPRHAGA